MTTFAHVINPVKVPPTSDLSVAQPITFASMRAARRDNVTQYAIGYAEDPLPDGFVALPPLTRSVLDLGRFQAPRKLPLLADILTALAVDASAEYLIYTNVDIGLQPHFYEAVDGLISAEGHSLVINRRTILARYDSPDDLLAMYAETGKPHPGWDCFIFPRALLPRFHLGQVCLGAGRVGLALLANLIAYSQRFDLLTDAHLTFHLGDDRTWRNPAFADYDAHNTRELMQALAAIEAEQGAFDWRSIPGRFLLKKRLFGPLYDWWSRR